LYIYIFFIFQQIVGYKDRPDVPHRICDLCWVESGALDAMRGSVWKNSLFSYFNKHNIMFNNKIIEQYALWNQLLDK
jgi:hypothetical protein